MATFLLLAAALPGTASAQGNETAASSASNQPSTGKSAPIGALTTDETTTGASGPQAQAMAAPAPPSPSTAAFGRFFCQDIRDETARIRCEAKSLQP